MWKLLHLYSPSGPNDSPVKMAERSQIKFQQSMYASVNKKGGSWTFSYPHQDKISTPPQPKVLPVQAKKLWLRGRGRDLPLSDVWMSWWRQAFFLRPVRFVCSVPHCACVRHGPGQPQPAPDVWPSLSLLSSQLASYLYAKKRGRELLCVSVWGGIHVWLLEALCHIGSFQRKLHALASCNGLAHRRTRCQCLLVTVTIRSFFI